MKSLIKRLHIIIGVLVCIHMHGDVLAQCTQRIEVSDVVSDNQNSRVSFSVKVVADQVYRGQIVRIEGTGQTLVTTFSGASEQSFTFRELEANNDRFFRVIIEYVGESSFLCKRRVKDVVIPDTN